MRITKAAKKETERRILAAARSRFIADGFDKTSTRDLARDAGIAAGTLFNYFATKEALAMTLVREALDDARDVFRSRWSDDETCDVPAEQVPEALFAHVATGLRVLRPYRHFLAEVFETALSPFNRSDASRIGEQVRESHLETVNEILHGLGRSDTRPALSIHLYWTLHLGVLAFWTHDESPNQSDTLAVLDRSLQLFVSSVDPAADGGDADAC